MTETPELPPHRIEPARSGRSRCKTCRRPIPKDHLRFGIRIEGPFGVGFLWHHLNCAAKRHLGHVEEAYRESAWDDGLKVPELATLQAMAEKAEARRKERKPVPRIEAAPTGRSKCKHCEETIEKGAPRVVVLRRVEFGSQVRHTPVNVHTHCVAGEADHEESAIEADTLLQSLRANSPDLDEGVREAAILEIGLPGA